MDLPTLNAAYQSIKAASKIAEILNNTNKKLEQAELKLKIAELMGNLADARGNMAKVKELIIEKNDKIKNLKESLKITGELVRKNDAYYFKDAQGEAKGDPVCPHCWEVENEIVHLVRSKPRQKICPSCKNTYVSRFTPRINNE